MCMPAARQTDTVLHDGPHCHSTHPKEPVPHPPIPFMITKGAVTVKIGGLPAARVTDMTQPCTLVPCVPAGPGLISKGSATVKIEGMPAARVLDLVTWASCAPVGGPTGKVVGPGCPTVMIGG